MFLTEFVWLQKEMVEMKAEKKGKGKRKEQMVNWYCISWFVPGVLNYIYSLLGEVLFVTSLEKEISEKRSTEKGKIKKKFPNIKWKTGETGRKCEI